MDEFVIGRYIELSISIAYADPNPRSYSVRIK